MNRRLKKIFDRLELQREFILSKVTEMPAEKYYYAPPHTWSVSLILTHLVVSERVSLMYLKKKVLGIEKAKNSGIFEFIKMRLLIASQRLPLKYKAPKFIIDHMSEALTIEEVVRQWKQLREDLRKFYETIPEKYARRKIFRHPFAGKFDLIQGMEFYYEHVRHHWPQIKRLL